MGRRPAPFSQYCFPLLKFSRENNFLYKYRDWPAKTSSQSASLEASAPPDSR
jgi:hypothetical protein